MQLRLHAFLPCSRANGPGKRAVLWVQGCSLDCPGCFNPGTHALEGGQNVAVEEFFQRIVDLGPAIEGVTLSGGEPLQQRSAVTELLARVREETNLSVIVFTGFTWAEVLAMEKSARLLRCVDVLIAGRYDATQRLAQSLRGSANKTVHFLSNRYGLADFEAIPEAEIVIAPDGELRASGIAPLRLG